MIYIQNVSKEDLQKSLVDFFWQDTVPRSPDAEYCRGHTPGCFPGTTGGSLVGVSRGVPGRASGDWPDGIPVQSIVQCLQFMLILYYTRYII